MRLFGRKDDQPHEPADRIPAFWAWWEETRPKLDALVAAGDTAGLAEALAPAVSRLDPDLVHEIAPGREAAHALVVTAAGDAELRPLAHRWAKAAPPSDLLWEFRPTREASPLASELTVEIAGREFALEQLTLGLRVPRGSARIDVAAYHPIFGDLDDEARMDATLLALDRLLGEDDVARWVGEITAATFPPIDAVASAHLRAVVDDIASGFDEEQWALLEGVTAGGASLVAAARYPLRPVDYPLYDQHVEITLPYSDRDENGLPQGDSLEALREFEERLTARLAEPYTEALLAAHLSAEGRRVVHVYADPAGRGALVAREVADGWADAGVEVSADPGWVSVAPFLS
ncbi:DUF695 domain-containing protein [Nonomuraea longicatena]|uniref:DUF695 domain-containing protein n=1 Tax=Nonomuraea longicatena TaxID=83682 RepID=A0ABN1P267_9ACTN